MRIKVRQEFFEAEFGHVVDPLDLVAKANLWHLVYGLRGSVRVLRVDEIVAAEMLEEASSYPEAFDLAQFWEGWCREYESRPRFIARVRLSPEAFKNLHHFMDEHAYRSLELDAPADAEGWVTLDLPFGSLLSARTRLLGLGRAVEVLAPLSLRHSLVDYAAQIVDFYKGKQ